MSCGSFFKLNRRNVPLGARTSRPHQGYVLYLLPGSADVSSALRVRLVPIGVCFIGYLYRRLAPSKGLDFLPPWERGRLVRIRSLLYRISLPALGAVW
jgi:hypothetical protein